MLSEIHYLKRGFRKYIKRRGWPYGGGGGLSVDGGFKTSAHYVIEKT